MAKADSEDKKQQALPPYVPFKTFQGFIRRFKDTIVPETIDATVMRPYPGSTARQLRAALRFLGIADEKMNPTPALSKLAASLDAPDWNHNFRSIIDAAYEPVIGDLPIEKATRTQLQGKFRERGAEGDVLDKCVAFYVAALVSAGVNVSPFILERAKPRTNGVRPRGSRKAVETTDDDDPTTLAPTSDTMRFAIPLPDRPPVVLTLPKGLTADEWGILDAMMRAYLSGGKK